MTTMKQKLAVTTALTLLALAATIAPSLAQDKKPVRVAFFSAWASNGYNQAIYNGAMAGAAEMGNVTVEMFDGENDAAHQFSQVEDIVTSSNFDAFVIAPNDATGIQAPVEAAVKSGMKGASVLFPIGPDLSTLEPQIEGLVATVADLPAEGARLQAEAVVEYCADKNPCKVLPMVGQLRYVTDNLRYETYKQVFAPHSNIVVLPPIEGKYDPDTSLKSMTDLLQVRQDVNAIVSAGDQHLVGAEIALQDAGIDPKSIFMMGGGASIDAVKAIREGRWSGTLAAFPYSMGKLAVEAVVKAARGDEVPSVIDMTKAGPVPPVVTKAVLGEHPDFLGEWQ